MGDDFYGLYGDETGNNGTKCQQTYCDSGNLIPQFITLVRAALNILELVYDYCENGGR